MHVNTKALVLVLTISNRIVLSQNTWSGNPHTGTHVHFVCLRVQTNMSCDDDTGNGWEDRNEDRDTMSTETPKRVSRAPLRKQKARSFLYACCTPLRPFLHPTLGKHPCPTRRWALFPSVFNLSEKGCKREEGGWVDLPSWTKTGRR